MIFFSPPAGGGGGGIPPAAEPASTDTITNPISGEGDLDWFRVPADTPFMAVGEVGDAAPRVYLTPRGLLFADGTAVPYDGEPFAEATFDSGYLTIQGRDDGRLVLGDTTFDNEVLLGNVATLRFTLGAETYGLSINGEGQVLVEGAVPPITGAKVTSPIGADYFLAVTDDGVLHTGTPPAAGGSTSFVSSYKYGVSF